MMPPILREARRAAGLTQKQLAERLGTSQSAIAQLESPRANPRVGTLERALRACDVVLSLTVAPANSSVDETLVAQRLRLSRGERIASMERGYADVRQIALAGARSRGELA